MEWGLKFLSAEGPPSRWWLMWLGIGTVADVYPTMNIGPRLRERREAELLSQFFELRQQIYQWSPQARAPVGPQSGPRWQNHSRGCHVCHAWCWLHPRGGDQHIEQIWTDLGLPWPCIFWTFAHIIQVWASTSMSELVLEMHNADWPNSFLSRRSFGWDWLSPSWCIRPWFANDLLAHHCHRIGWWENLQESPIFDGKNHGFL